MRPCHSTKLTRMRPKLSQLRESWSRSQSFDLEANLRSWGLIGHTAIKRQESTSSRMVSLVKRKIIWHRLKLLILWLFVGKLFYTCTLTNDDPLTYYLGDASGFMAAPKLEMGLIMALWTLPGPIIISEFIKFKNTKRMQSWVRIYDMYNKNIIEGFNHNNILQKVNDQRIRRLFRQRISRTKKLFQFFVTGALTCGGGSIAWTVHYNWPEEYRTSLLAYFWSFVSAFWIYYNQKSIKSCLIIFNQICYYITLRFRKFDSNIRHLATNWDKYHESNGRRLWALLREHDSISDLTLNCNKFWSLFILTNTAIKVPLLLLAIHVTFTFELSVGGHFVAIFMTASIFSYTTLIYYSASQVEYASRQSQPILYELSTKRLSVPLRYKLLSTIQRISVRRIGFDIKAVHTINYLEYFQLICSAGIGFLLVVQLKFNSFESLMTESQ